MATTWKLTSVTKDKSNFVHVSVQEVVNGVDGAVYSAKVHSTNKPVKAGLRNKLKKIINEDRARKTSATGILTSTDLVDFETFLNT